MQTPPHIPVLRDEVVEAFRGVKGKIVDCTLGYAGHSSALLQSFPDIGVIGIDRDIEAIEFSTQRLAPFKDRVEIIKGRFSEVLPSLLRDRGEEIGGILADFGVSSLQLDKADRGFSFSSEILDMRMDRDALLSAYEVVNEYPKQRLEYILREYGEIKNPSKIVSEIIKHRPIKSAKELADIAVANIKHSKKIHPATLLFQAIRIEVNDELGEIERLLDAIENNPPKGATIALITFHSLEDRLIKRRFNKWATECICPPDIYRCVCGGDNAIGKNRPKKPIIATDEETRLNPRSRSAKLRLFQINGD